MFGAHCVSMHMLEDVCPVNTVNFPAEQLVHACAPAAAEYVPATQSAQTVSAVVEPYLPGSQSVQVPAT